MEEVMKFIVWGFVNKNTGDVLIREDGFPQALLTRKKARLYKTKNIKVIKFELNYKEVK